MEKEERKDREENSKVNLVILRTFRGVPVKKTPCRWGEKWGDGREEQKVRRSGWDSGELEGDATRIKKQQKKILTLQTAQNLVKPRNIKSYKKMRSSHFLVDESKV